LENLLCSPDAYLVMVRVLLLRVIDHRGRVIFSFSFLFSLFFFVFGRVILDIFKHHVGAEAGCNWYLLDINIFPFKKIQKLKHGLRLLPMDP